MSKEQPIIIIGGGLTGVTTLYELVSRNIPAILIDSESAVAQGTSYANGGVLHPSLPDPWNTPNIAPVLLASLFDRNAPIKLHLAQVPALLGWGMQFLRNSVLSRHLAITQANFDLANYSTRQTDALQQFLGLKFEDAAPGTLKIFRNPQEREAALRLADFLAPQGLTHQLLDRDALLTREPSVANATTPISGALLFPDDRIGNARLFCAQLAEHAIARGGEIRYATTAKQLLVKNGQLVGVRLAEEDLFGQVVICAGVGAPKLTAQLGVKLPIRPAKGYSITLKADQLTVAQPVHPLVDASLHIAVTPLGQHLRVLGMAEFIGMDRQLDPHRVTMLRQFFEQLLPDVAEQLDWQTAENWCGLRPMSSDGRPFIGPTPMQGLWLNCGHGHLGWTKAVGSARLLADQIAGRKPEINPAPFAYDKRQRLSIFA
jgi:D-amino-acid dehydrogenase